MKIVEYLESLSETLIVLISLLIVVIIGAIDYSITIDLSLSIFYLIPVTLTTWFVSRKWGIIISILSATSWLIGYANTGAYKQAMIIPWNAGVRFVFFMVVSYLLATIKNAYEREKKYARIDSLTNAFNRRFFGELLEREIERYARYQRPFTLVYFDLDNFKIVNDKFGHSTGDRLLCLITETIKMEVRATDIIARLGGDEFALLLPETDYQGAQKNLRRLQQKLLATVRDDYANISMSIGAITIHKLPESPDSILEKADSLMYQVKSSGKNGLKHEIFA